MLSLFVLASAIFQAHLQPLFSARNSTLMLFHLFAAPLSTNTHWVLIFYKYTQAIRFPFSFILHVITSWYGIRNMDFCMVNDKTKLKYAKNEYNRPSSKYPSVADSKQTKDRQIEDELNFDILLSFWCQINFLENKHCTFLFDYYEHEKLLLLILNRIKFYFWNRIVFRQS